jgi:histidinol-phosphate aminotransferase
VQELAVKALEEIGQVNDMIVTLVNERQNMVASLLQNEEVVKIYPSDANFLLVKFKNASGLYKYFVEQGIVVRDRSNVVLCEDCLRITVGTPLENTKLLESLKSFNQ